VPWIDTVGRLGIYQRDPNKTRQRPELQLFGQIVEQSKLHVTSKLWLDYERHLCVLSQCTDVRMDPEEGRRGANRCFWYEMTEANFEAVMDWKENKRMGTEKVNWSEMFYKQSKDRHYLALDTWKSSLCLEKDLVPETILRHRRSRTTENVRFEPDSLKKAIQVVRGLRGSRVQSDA